MSEHTLTQGETADRLELFVRTQFAVAPADTRFSRSAALFELGYVDSVGVVELLAFVREEFGVDIPDENLLSDEFASVDGIARIVCRLMPACLAPRACPAVTA